MADLVMAPYLPLKKLIMIGDWRLTPFADLAELLEAMPPSHQRSAERLIEAYAQDDMGMIVHTEGGNLGDDHKDAELRWLSQALLAGAVGANPQLAENETSGNSGWRLQTSENATLLGHRLEDSNSYSIETGMLARVLQIQAARDGEPLPEVTPPLELPRPISASFDEDLAQSTFSVLRGEGLQGRQLHRALEWFRVAFSNADAVPADVRVGAARSAFEVLIGAGNTTQQLVRGYGLLVREDADPPPKTFSASEVFWSKGSAQLTAEEWWMTQLCRLRNAIMHGDEVPKDLWSHEDHHHVNWIHDKLLKALRARVSQAVDDQLLRLPYRDRIFPRAYQRLEERGQAP